MLDIDLDELFNFSNITDETDEDEPGPMKALTVPKYIRKIAEGVHYKNRRLRESGEMVDTPRGWQPLYVYRQVKCWTIYAMWDGRKVVMHDDHLDLSWDLDRERKWIW